MLISIVLFEWRYHTRQISFAAAVILFAAFGAVLAGTGFGPKNVNVNSPYAITESLGLASLCAVFAVAVFCSGAVLRDRDHQMEELVFTTPVVKRDLLAGRFTGAFLAAFTAFAATPAGMLVALAAPWQDRARLGPVNVFDYLWPLFVLVLPGMLLSAVVLFGVAAMTRSMVATVVGAVAIYVLYFAASALTGSPLMASSSPGVAGSSIAAVFDPFGLAGFFEQTKHWTPLVRNDRSLALTGVVLTNRLVILATAAVGWFFVERRFVFGLLPDRQRRPFPFTRSRNPAGRSEEKRKTPETGRDGVPYVPVNTEAGRQAQWRALISATRLEIRSLFGGWPFIILTLLWTALALVEMISDVSAGEYGAALVPVTPLLMNSLAQPFALIASIVIIYYSAEIVWRDRTVGVAEIVHATPAPGSLFLASKWLALTAAISVLAGSASLAAVGIQLARGSSIEPLLLAGFAAIAILPMALFGIAALVIQVLSPQKYLGMLFVLALAGVMQAGAAFGLDHPLWRFGTSPPLSYSAMNGFGSAIATFGWFMSLWTAIAAVLFVVAAALWRRSAGDRTSRLPARLRKSWKEHRLLVSFLVISAFGLFGWIFFNTNIRNDWTSSASRLDWRAAYERRFRRLDRVPEPRIAGITAEIALEPGTRRYAVRGTCDLVNDSGSMVQEILVGYDPGTNVKTLELGAASTRRDERRFGSTLFRLERVLRPGEHLPLRFEFLAGQSGFTGRSADRSVETNGTVLLNEGFPTIGYRRTREIDDPSERAKRGLPAGSSRQDESGDVPAAGWIDSDLTVSTDRDQRVLAPGRLVREWEAGGRRWFRYRSNGPIHATTAIVSARYARSTATVDGVQVEVDYDSRHAANVPRILDAASRSLDIFSRTFGRYPSDRLTLAEVPAYQSFGGFATPGLVLLSESRVFLIDTRDARRLDLVTRRTAHEVAHQWWGHHVAPVPGPGASMIVESLTKLSELLVLESRYGRAAVRQSLGYELDLYLSGRTSDSVAEPPLASVGDQAYLYYRKGAVVFSGIRDLLGAERLAHALKRFAAETGGPTKSARADQLIEIVESEATPAERALIEDWTRRVVLYDLKLSAARTVRRADGQYESKLTIEASRRAVDQRGGERELALDEPVTIGLFTTDPDVAAASEVLHAIPHRLESGTNVVSITTPTRPSFAAVDPYYARVDVNRFDDVRRVE